MLALVFALAVAVPGPPQAAPLRELGPGTIELRAVDLAGNPLHGVEWRYRFEDESTLPIADERAPGGRRQGLRFERAPRPSDVDRALRDLPWSAASAPRIELRPERALVIEARRDEAWGFLWLPRDWRTTAGRAHAEGAPLALELAPDWSVRVRVEDAGGRPTKTARVGLRCEELRFDESDTWEPEEHVFVHVGYEARRAHGTIRVALAELLDPPVEAQLDARRAPAAPVRLRLPPTGAVEVHVRPHEERRSQPSVALAVAGNPLVAAHALVRDGVARFEHVGLGLRLAARLHSGDTLARTEFDGPRWAGEVVTLELAEPAPIAEPELEPSAFAAPAPPVPMATVSGFLLLDPGIPLDQLELVASAPFVDGCSYVAQLALDGKFELALPAGRMRFEVRAQGLCVVPAEEARPAFQIDLDLASGESAPAALQVIDLRGKLFAHTVRTPGRVVADARALYGPRTWPRSQRAYAWLTRPPLTVVSPWPRVDLELYVPGYRAVELLDVEREVEVELQPGLPVELRLATSTALPAPPFELVAVLQPPERLMRVTNWSARAFDAQRTLATTAFVPGPNQVVWLVRHGSRAGAHVTREPQFVQVLDSPNPQVFTLELPADELARWLAEAR